MSGHGEKRSREIETGDIKLVDFLYIGNRFSVVDREVENGHLVSFVLEGLEGSNRQLHHYVDSGHTNIVKSRGEFTRADMVESLKECTQEPVFLTWKVPTNPLLIFEFLESVQNIDDYKNVGELFDRFGLTTDLQKKDFAFGRKYENRKCVVFESSVEDKEKTKVLDMTHPLSFNVVEVDHRWIKKMVRGGVSYKVKD